MKRTINYHNLKETDIASLIAHEIIINIIIGREDVTVSLKYQQIY